MDLDAALRWERRTVPSPLTAGHQVRRRTVVLEESAEPAPGRAEVGLMIVPGRVAVAVSRRNVE